MVFFLSLVRVDFCSTGSVILTAILRMGINFCISTARVIHAVLNKRQLEIEK